MSDSRNSVLSWEVIERYLADDLPPAERARVAAILEDDPAGMAVRAIRDVLNDADTGPDPDILQTQLRTRLGLIHRSMETMETTQSGIPTTDRKHKTLWSSPRSLPTRRALVAAVGLCLVIGTWVSLQFLRHTPVTPAVTYRTAVGERARVRLPDGSTMMLAPATTVQLARDAFHVDGEAYFEVTARSQPFVVQTGRATVQVLGTTFAVRQYPGEPSTRVVVEDGKVAVRSRRVGANAGTNAGTNESIVLARGMLARVTDSSVAMDRGIATSDYTGWTRGTLVFNWVSLGDVVTELSRTYGADIRVADSMLARKRMRFEVTVAEQSLPQVLDLISLVADAHYVTRGQEIVLSPGRKTSKRESMPRRLDQPQQEAGYGK